ncbi:hypothetical protein BX666DRAFT_2030607 [Dichotomocladium elegans]|nr:hypothetical protein BX666DRAFT_2030607 [Dichotomocladium elegans]
MIPRSDRSIFLALLIVANVIPFTKQQDDGSGGGDGDPYDDGSSNSDSSDDSSSGSQSDCALITGHSCNANGICKYCAMCLEDECILSKSVAANSSSEVSQTAADCSSQADTNVYNWYGYCLSSGNDNDGDYCATSVECYQYRKTTNGSSVSHLWQNLTCDANSCLLTTARGGAPPPPGQIPPVSTTSPGENQASSTAGAGEGNDNENSGHHHHEFTPRSATAIALMVTCSFIIVVGLLWLAQLWTKRRKRNRRPTLSVTSSIPSSAPPSFQSNSGGLLASGLGASAGTANGRVPEMTQWRRLSRSSSLSSLHSVEPLPSYFSPDPSPPKYEQAIVTQIRGLMAARGTDEGNEENATEQYQHNDPLPPPMWLPIYFTPNQSAFSFGRLRRHPPFAASSSSRAQTGASSSSSSAAISAHEQDNAWSDPMRAFWYHHQQQLEQLNRNHQNLPSPQSQQQPQHRSEDEDRSSSNT